MGPVPTPAARAPTPFRIDLLDATAADVARQIHAVLIPAYAQEAALLQAPHFPPLDTTVQDIQAGRGTWLGAMAATQLVGALSVEADDEPDQWLISSLVVHPAHQRQGVARALLAEVLRRHPGRSMAVATGARNAPALALYRSAGFVVYRHGSIGPQALPLVKLRRT